MSIDTSTTAPAGDRDSQLNEIIITATGAAVADDVDNALVVFRADGEGIRQVATDIRIGDHRMTVDEPPTLGGENTDPNPVETVLAGLLSCQVVTYRFCAAKLGIPLDRVHVETEGDLDVRGFFGLDDAVRPGFGEIRFEGHPRRARRATALPRAAGDRRPALPGSRCHQQSHAGRHATGVTVSEVLRFRLVARARLSGPPRRAAPHRAAYTPGFDESLPAEEVGIHAFTTELPGDSSTVEPG
jgi:hypothetical protein